MLVQLIGEVILGLICSIAGLRVAVVIVRMAVSAFLAVYEAAKVIAVFTKKMFVKWNTTK